MNVTVRRGDCLWSIAQSHGVSLKQLIAANPQIKNPSLIFAGQVVHLPGDGFVSPRPTPKPVPSLPPTTTREYQRHATAHPETIFKQQFRSRFNPTGPSRSSNCGPTSVAMAVKAFGLEPHGLTIEQSIDRVRKLMDGTTNDHDPTTTAEQARGARAAGLHAQRVSLSHLDAELAAGHMVVAIGAPNARAGSAYTSQFQRYPEFDGLHAILIVGKTSDGRYVVNDPCSRTGPVKLTAAQMHAYWAGGGGYGTSVWR